MREPAPHTPALPTYLSGHATPLAKLPAWQFILAVFPINDSPQMVNYSHSIEQQKREPGDRSDGLLTGALI